MNNVYVWELACKFAENTIGPIKVSRRAVEITAAFLHRDQDAVIADIRRYGWMVMNE